MEDEIKFPKIEIVSSKANFKIALTCGVFGAVFSIVAYALVKSVTIKTIDNVNIALKEEFVIIPKDDPTL